MAYFLGRDLDIALLTENLTLGLGLVTTSSVRSVAVLDFSNAGGGTYYSAQPLFAGPRLAAYDGDPDLWVAVNDTDQVEINSLYPTWNNRPANITGVDLSVSTQDEDVQFIGQRNILKAEIKKENSITLTRKKSDDVWDVIFNEARFGLDESGLKGDGHYQPDFTGYGYRVALRFKSGTAGVGEVFVLPNCCITEHTVTLGADSSQEESLTFVSYVDPIIVDGATDTSAEIVAAVGEM
jgi:hypothetical protein